MSRWYLTTISAADIDSILKIEKKSFARTWGRASYLSELACRGAFSYVVKCARGAEAGRDVAFIFLRIIEDELHIMRIAVAPEWRGSGVAAWLLDKCFQQARRRGAVSAYLEVRPSNTKALALYRKLGFQVIGKRCGYYAETGEDALVLMKNLKEEL